MLTQTLRSLERDGLITRTAVATVPVSVTYELTDLGHLLHRIVRELKGWAGDNMDEILRNRDAHDSRAR
jgi:DNA-binding HxlR family transcriptional regulator